MRHRVVVWIGLLVLIAGTGCNDSPTAPSGAVEYRITGSATRVDVTYTNASGGTSQVANAAVPWTYGWSGATSGDFLYVSGQIVNTSGGTITATITKNGSTLQTSTSTGFASIATASGTF